MGEREPWTEAEGGPAREPETGERGERSVGLRPRIYVASLADYNAGRLHGAWVDAAAEPEDVRAAIAGVLGSSGEPGAEEWAIHDYDEFGGIPLGEYQSVETVTALARGLVAHGEAFGAYVALVGVAHAEERGFMEHYRGWWQTAEAYAENLLDEWGATEALAALPEWLHGYVQLQVAGFAHDLEYGGTVTYMAGNGGVYVFENA